MLRHRRSLLALGLLCGALVALSPSPASGAALIAMPPRCSSSFHWYAYTRAALATCGIRTYPLSSVVPVAGGGKDYRYDLPNGGVAHEYVPPKGFDAATASASARAAYGIAPVPPANSGLRGLVLWSQSLKHITFGSPTPYLATSDATAPAYSGDRSGTGASLKLANWAGYGLCANFSDTFANCYDGVFTSVAGLYAEPSYNNHSCAGESVGGVPVPPATLIWAGLGGVNKTTQLAQAGTAHNIGVADHGTWFELVPGLKITPFPTGEYTASIGDAIVPIVEYITGIYYFEVYDATTGQVSQMSVGEYPYTGESAEVVAERPEVTVNGVNYLTALGNFTSPIGFASEADGAWFNNYPATGWRYGIHMVEHSTRQDLADPSNMYAPNGDFILTYANCGGLEVVPNQ